MLEVAQLGGGRAGILSDSGPWVSCETGFILQRQGGSRQESRWLASQGHLLVSPVHGHSRSLWGTLVLAGTWQPGHVGVWYSLAGWQGGALGRCPLAWGWTLFFKLATRPSGAAPSGPWTCAVDSQMPGSTLGSAAPSSGRGLRPGVWGGPRPGRVHFLLHSLRPSEAELVSPEWGAGDGGTDRRHSFRW